MAMTEDMVSTLVRELTGGYKVKYHPAGSEEDESKAVEIDFTPPFKRIPMVAGVEEAGGFTIPKPLESDEARAFLDATCARLEVRLCFCFVFSSLGAGFVVAVCLR